MELQTLFSKRINPEKKPKTTPLLVNRISTIVDAQIIKTFSNALYGFDSAQPDTLVTLSGVEGLFYFISSITQLSSLAIDSPRVKCVSSGKTSQV
ncbi:hypothetical protein Aoki45_22220 [Algoriphagus sp. oki45]|nr:hypothetical protein Aoki45_22220 [Algoriphagus sp. oki45]